MEENGDKINRKRTIRSILRRVPINISRTSERFFYQLGLRIAQRPTKWLAGSTVIVLFCLAGLLRFRQERNPLKLWVPPDSDFVKDTEWLMNNFGEGMRVQTLMMTGENVLEPRALLKLNEASNRIFKARTNVGLNASWTDVCFKVPIIPGRMKRQTRSTDDFIDQDTEEIGLDYISILPTSLYCRIYNELEKSCYGNSVLDLWKFDDDLIRNLTTDDILNSINTVKTSPTLGHNMNYSKLLGEITRDDKGLIIGAKAVKSQWFLHVNFSEVNMDEIGNDVGTADWATETVLEWETAFLKAAEESAEELRKDNSQDFSFWYEAARSFGDVSASTMFQDINRIVAGVFLMSIYVQLLLSKFNWVEWRFCLTSAGLMCVGGAFIIAVGICSLVGVPYGPVHTSLPFLLMGLGVDDIFVMMAAWDQVHSEEANFQRPLPVRIAMMLSHAGSSIFITSLTDVVAFVIGASTILPSLQSFCIYAAVGVFVTFLLQVTFFVAFFTLDTRRIEAKRNGIFPCIVHPDHQLILNDEKRLSWRFTGFVYSRGILTRTGKITVLVITGIIAAFGIHGSTLLEQRFDPEWFLPEKTYLAKYLSESKDNFPGRGHEGAIFMGEFNYTKNFDKILSLSRTLNRLRILDSVDQWPVKFTRFVERNYYEDASTISEDKFQDYLSQFLFSETGGKYQQNFRFNGNLTCGEIAPPIKISTIDFIFSKFSHPEEWIGAMNRVKELCKKSDIDGFVTSWSKMFASWVTDEVIAQEVTRNLILALICVMGTTAVLVAELQTCFWIFVCVLLTLVDVCGLMYYWGLTVDIVSCIGLELAVGLSVDYAAHVAHAFLISEIPDENGDRTARALSAVKHIGAAVVFGAGSTLLALSLLAASEAYVFRSFFKIFLLVVLIGLWHGLIFLPVILSTVGPKSLRNDDRNRKGKANKRMENGKLSSEENNVIRSLSDDKDIDLELPLKSTVSEAAVKEDENREDEQHPLRKIS